jgi:hypothetical protein
VPAEQKNAPLHGHDLELANRGGILLRDADVASESEQASDQQKDSEQTRHAESGPRS